ncbi:MAG: long-chain-fatty-acid--CoA ligase [Rhizobiaceae bacterium]
MLTGDMLRRSAERFPNKPAILWDGTSLTYRSLDREANQLANALLERGVTKGCKIGVLCRNRTEYGIAFFGIARSGAVIVNVSVLYSPEELAYVLGKAEIEVLFYEEMFSDKVESVFDHLETLQSTISIGGEGDEFRNYYSESSSKTPDIEIDEDDPFCMTYTGGTTGRPKGVLVSHRNRAVTAHTVLVEEALDERDIIGIVTPLFHVAALNIMFQPAILAGATTMFLSKWGVEAFSDMAEKTAMTAAFMVPTQVSMVVSDPKFDATKFATFRKLSFAGAPMPDWVQTEVMKKLPDVRLTQIYGQSEVGVLTALKHWHLPEKLGSIGRQAFNVDVAVIDSDGNHVAPGEIGEIVSRGDNIMLEYFNEPEQTKAFWRHGWAHTDDVGTIDEDGFIILIDRSKDMIISGGENIYPKEIENCIYELDEIAETAVFGIPDDKWGEVPAAYVMLKAGSTIDEHAVVDHCASALAAFKRPRIIKFVKEFPKTPIGKIQKNILREPYWKNREKKI